MDSEENTSQMSSRKKSSLSFSGYIGDDDLEFSILTFFGVFDSISNVPIKTLGSLNRHFRENKVRPLQRKVDKELEKLKGRITDKVDKLQKKWVDGNVVRARDKVAFVLGVGNVFFSALLMGMSPQNLHVWYSVQILYFMPLRYITYHRKGMHYFIADLCYWLLVYLWIFPSSKFLLVSTYFLSFGSLSWAIIAWKNSLVFHSMDKVTSLFIHIFPPTVLHTIIHIVPADYTYKRFPALEKLEHIDIFPAFIATSIAYFVWQILYYIFIQVRRREKISAGRPTSFTWLLKSYSKTWIGKFVLTLPEPTRPFAFMAIQYIYALITMAPCPWWYSHKKSSTIFLISLFAWSVWNGASYYVDVFGRRFQKELEDLRREVSTYDNSNISYLSKVDDIVISGDSFLNTCAGALKTELQLNKSVADSDSQRNNMDDTKDGSVFNTKRSPYSPLEKSSQILSLGSSKERISAPWTSLSNNLPNTSFDVKNMKQHQVNNEFENVNYTHSELKSVFDPKVEFERLMNTRAGGVYVPPARLKALQAQITDKESKEYQRMYWEALKKSINVKVNTINIKNIVVELFGENLIRGRGLYCRSIMKAQAVSLPFTPIYSALTAIINTKLPSIGELLLTRLIVQFRKAYKRNDKFFCLSSTMFIAHLINHQVAQELVALEILALLLERPSNDAVEVAVGFMREVGAYLADVSPRGSNAVFERFRAILHEGAIEKRVQYMIEVLFQVRRDKYKDNPIIPEGLDLVEDGDQITHMLSLNDELDVQEGLGIFKYDPQWQENEDQYKKIKDEILGDDTDESSDSESSSESTDEQVGDDKMHIKDETNQALINLRRTIYLTIMSSVNFEECAHKLMKINIQEGQEIEMCNMIIECCSQERTYSRFYGLIGERFCKLNRFWTENFEQTFLNYYDIIHRYETNRLRNIATFFGHLLSSDAISWHVMRCIHLNEDETTSSSRIFVKILFQELMGVLGIRELDTRLKDPNLQESLCDMFPRNNPKNIRFAINYFTSIGLGMITVQLREHLETIKDDINAKQSLSKSISSPISTASYTTSYLSETYSNDTSGSSKSCSRPRESPRESRRTHDSCIRSFSRQQSRSRSCSSRKHGSRVRSRSRQQCRSRSRSSRRMRGSRIRSRSILQSHSYSRNHSKMLDSRIYGHSRLRSRSRSHSRSRMLNSRIHSHSKLHSSRSRSR
ncbi:hypothetical protein PMAC_003351 [Pneumocystis sp. 'macacae']|nr:hypothetical protein PMAC_003351 [Pneumocystis sp. 'macacae']